MSKSLYTLGGLRFWNEEEIQARNQLVDSIVMSANDTLTNMNPAWKFVRMEGPCLSPRDRISTSYDDDDIFVTNHAAGGSNLCLRAETTPSSYEYAKWIMNNDRRYRNPPLCVWQVGKSFRRETNDGANASKLRYNEFYQLELQCIYSRTTNASYRPPLMQAAGDIIGKETGLPVRMVSSDRLPSYSQSTIDIEVETAKGWREMASCSIRTDFSTQDFVLELAIGLDRVLDVRV